MATKYGSDGWNCAIVGDKEIPKERISRWKIKLKKMFLQIIMIFIQELDQNHLKGVYIMNAGQF